MSKRVVVVVPVARDTVAENDGASRSGNRLVASVAITSSDGKLVVERAGIPVKQAQAAEDDSVVVGFAAACARAGRNVPDGLRVRVSPGDTGEHTRQGMFASTVAGVAAANALLVLRMNDEELAEIAARIVGSSIGRITAALSNCRVVVHHDCDDGSTGDGAQALIAGSPNDTND